MKFGLNFLILLSAIFAVKKSRGIGIISNETEIKQNGCNQAEYQLMQMDLQKCLDQMNLMQANDQNNANISVLQNSLQQSEEYSFQLSQQIVELQNQISEYKMMVQQRDTQIKNLRSAAENQTNTQNQNLQNQLNKCQATQRNLNIEIQNLQKNNQELSQRYVELETNFVSIRSNLEMTTSELNEWKQKCSNITFIEETTENNQNEGNGDIGLGFAPEFRW